MNETPHEMTIEGARCSILILRDQIAQMGANNSEIPIINKILEQLTTGEINPEEAVKTVTQILEAKDANY